MKRFITTCLVAVLLPAALTAAPAHAASHAHRNASPEKLVTLFTKYETLTSSTGKHLITDVAAFSDNHKADAPGDSLLIGLEDQQGEGHQWGFNPSGNWFTYNGQSGRGRIVGTTSALAPFGLIRLTIFPAGPDRVRTCANGATNTTRRVTVSGTLLFKTHSLAWGRIGSAHRTMTFTTKSTVNTQIGDVSNTCAGYPSRRPVCAGGSDFEGPGGPRGSISASTSRRTAEHPLINYGTQRSVGANDDALLMTEIFLRKGRLSQHTRADGTVVETLHAGSSGLITGSGTLVSTGSPSRYGGTCKGPKSRSWDARYTPGPEPLTVHQEVGGTVSFHSSSSNGVSISQDAG